MATKGSAEHKKAISKGIKRHHRLKKAAIKRGKPYVKRKPRSDAGVTKGPAFKLGSKFKKAIKKTTPKRKKRSDKGKARGYKLGPNFKPAKKVKVVKRKKRSDKGKKRGINQMATLKQMNR